MRLKHINFRNVTDNDLSLPWLDHTTITALLACPKWGMLRYVEGKAVVSERALALEAGGVLHQCFAIHRLHYVLHRQNNPEPILDYGRRLLGNNEERFDNIAALLGEDDPQSACLETLYTSGYYDDPSDKKRTLSNLEVSLLYYLSRCDLSMAPPVVAGDFVGIEVPIHFVIEFITEDNACHSVRYAGRCDGVSRNSNGLMIDENKTSTGIAGQWEMQWHTSHQPTGYMMGVQLLLNEPVTQANIIGLQIGLPRNVIDGYKSVSVERYPRQFSEWAKWVWSGYQVMIENAAAPHEAPMHTQYCYRFFRNCSFLPLCAADDEGFTMGIGELVNNKWNPLDEHG